MSRDGEILKHSLLGWTQQEISEIFGVSQQTVSVVTKKFATELISIHKRFFDKGDSIEDIAKNL